MFLRLSAAIIGLLVLVPASVGAGDLYRPLCIKGTCVKWQPTLAGEALVLTWAVARRSVDTPDAFNCRDLRPPANLMERSSIPLSSFRQALASAFSIWERALNISFIEASDQDAADIVIGEQGTPLGYAFTNVTMTSAPGAPTSIGKALICLNPVRRWKIGYDGNLAVYDLVHTFAHEIGHAIGLDHPDRPGHLMSFRYQEIGRSLSDGDLQGGIRLYGARVSAGQVLRIGASPARPASSPEAE